jgi:predicted DCC family thiol-disulfide oxidoreductase YuxK
MTRVQRPAQDQRTGEHLILYDGVCGLCNRTNAFVLSRDRRELFDFASLQSAFGRSVLRRFGKEPEDLDTFYVVTDYRRESSTLLSKSGAALFVTSALVAPWRWLRVFGVLPRGLRDRVYDLVASNRYRFFGRYESCPMPRVEHRKRFIDV